MKSNLRLLYLFCFCKSLMFFGALAVPFYLHRIGLNYKGMFTLEAIFSLAMIIFEIPTGVVADRFGRKKSLFLGAWVSGTGILMFGLYTSFIVLVFAEIICAFGMTLLSGADRAILYETLKYSGEESKATKVMSRYDAFGTAGMFLAFPAGSIFAGCGILPYRSALGFVFTATAIAFYLAGIAVIFVKDPPYDKSIKGPMQQGLDGFLRILRVPRLRIFSFNYALISSLTFFMFWFYQSLLMENSFPITWQGFIASAYNGTAMLLLLLMPFAERKIGIKNTLFLSSLLPGVFYLFVSFIPGLVMALIAIFVVTNLKIFRAPLLIALMNTEIETENRATVLSGVSMIERIATAILYPMAGVLTDISLKETFLVIGALTIALSLLLRIEEESLAV